MAHSLPGWTGPSSNGAVPLDGAGTAAAFAQGTPKAARAVLSTSGISDQWGVGWPGLISLALLVVGLLAGLGGGEWGLGAVS